MFVIFLILFFFRADFFSRVLFFSNTSIDILTLKNIVWNEDNNINIYIKNSIIRTTQISRIKQSSGVSLSQTMANGYDPLPNGESY